MQTQYLTLLNGDNTQIKTINLRDKNFFLHILIIYIYFIKASIALKVHIKTYKQQMFYNVPKISSCKYQKNHNTNSVYYYTTIKL